MPYSGTATGGRRRSLFRIFSGTPGGGRGPGPGEARTRMTPEQVEGPRLMFAEDDVRPGDRMPERPFQAALP